MDAYQNNGSKENAPSVQRDILDLVPNKSFSASPLKKRLMGRDATKEAKKKAASTSSWILFPTNPLQLAHQENVSCEGTQQKWLRRKQLQHHLGMFPRCMTYLFERLSYSRK